MDNHFTHAPTVGNQDHVATIDELSARIYRLEQRFDESETRQREADDRNAYSEKRKGKIRWGKVRKFFSTFIKPILEFIPRLINAMASYKKAAHA